jgi:hypothetical protein
MRFLFAAALAVLMLAQVQGANAETARRATPPEIDETQDATIGATQDATKKAEYLEARPYKPCPSSVRFPNGQHACLGLPGYPDGKVRTDDPNE